MLAQFQSLYPQACLISELVQIDHGKYIVRASVQIEGVTRATGLAAAETLEDAEDRARTRALMVLGIASTTKESTPSSAKPIMQIHHTNSTSLTTSELNESSASAYSAPTNSFPQTEAISSLLQTETHSPNISQPFPTISNYETEDNKGELGKASDTLSLENNTLPSISTTNVTPFAPRNYNQTPTEDLPTKPTPPTEKKKKKSEPIDLSDVIAKTDVHIERLGWTKEQGKEFLKKKYGKIGRTLLNEEELLDFLKYLESQPTPLDPLAGF
jgi:hypothetical protein